MPPLPAYAELHCLSNFTFLRGASHADELVERAAALGYAALAITDECSLAGIVRAHEAAKEVSLKLIVGSEVQLADGPKLVLLATDREGYGNLSALITRGRRSAEKGSYRLERKDLADGVPGCLVVWAPKRLGVGTRMESTGGHAGFAPAALNPAYEGRETAHRTDIENEALNPTYGEDGATRRHVDTGNGMHAGFAAARLDPAYESNSASLPGNDVLGRSANEAQPSEADVVQMCVAEGAAAASNDGGHEEAPAAGFAPAALDPAYGSKEPSNCTNIENGVHAGFAAARLNPAYGACGSDSAGGTSAPGCAPGSAANQEYDAACGHAHWLRKTFPDRAWIAVELHRSPGDGRHVEALRALSRHSGLPLVAAGDVHMHRRSRRALQDVLTAIRLGVTVKQAGFALYPNGERYLRSRARLAHLYDAQWLAESVRIAERCTFSLDELRYEYPDDMVPADETPSAYLRRLTEQGVSQRWPEGVPQRVRAQIESELATIAELRYEPYFLTVYDIVSFARSRGILCQGRGSAANSAVCYCLGITSVDPSRMDMLFERFVSTERNEPPDIDVDFEHERREEVLQYLYARYGRERAALAATVISYRRKSALRDVGKALGLSLDQVDRLASTVAWWDIGVDEGRLAEVGFDPDSPVIRKVLALVQELLGFPRHLSQHVGGFVIAKGPVSRLVPIENAAMEDRTVIQWDKDDLDAMGLLKVDCLGLGMLSAIHRAFDLVALHRGRQLTLANVPAEDPAVYDLISAADTVGVFQIESRAQMSMLPRLRPRCFYDLVIEVAIVRPGPIQGQMVHPYLKRRQGLEPISFPSEEVRAVLERTMGVPIFQEQVIKLAMVAAGFSAGEADQLRRAIGSWRRKDKLERFRIKLLEGMRERGYEESFAEQIFQQIEGFGEYGFPESHSASFALLVYVSAWLKRHEPAAFVCALLNSQPMGFYAPAQLVQDARRHDVEVRPVDVTMSEWDCTLEPVDEAAPCIAPGSHTPPAVPGVPPQTHVGRIKERSDESGIASPPNRCPIRYRLIGPTSTSLPSEPSAHGNAHQPVGRIKERSDESGIVSPPNHCPIRYRLIGPTSTSSPSEPSAHGNAHQLVGRIKPKANPAQQPRRMGQAPAGGGPIASSRNAAPLGPDLRPLTQPTKTPSPSEPSAGDNAHHHVGRIKERSDESGIVSPPNHCPIRYRLIGPTSTSSPSEPSAHGNAHQLVGRIKPKANPAQRPSPTQEAETSTALFSQEHHITEPKPPLALRLGLRMVRGLSAAGAERLVAARAQQPFRSVDDLQRRAQLSRRDLDLLASAGALAPLAGHRHLARWETLGTEGTLPLFDELHIEEAAPVLPVPSEAQELIADYGSVGLTLGRHPLSFLRCKLQRLGCVTAAQFTERPNGSRLRYTGLVVTRQHPASAAGVVFLTLEDETGSVNIIVWQQLVERYRREVLGSRLLQINGVLQREGEVIHLVARHLQDRTPLLGNLDTRSRDFC